MSAQWHSKSRESESSRAVRPVSLAAWLILCMLGLTLGLGLTQRLGAQESAAAPDVTAPSGAAPPQYAQQSPEQLQQLVAPIALYPDSLVAQILAAATFPEQVVEADRWLQANPGVKGDALAQAVSSQPWDDSVKALTAFPDVLGNMDRNLSWTSSLGDAYYNQPEDVMSAVQVMRQRAAAAGNLRTTPQQVVTTEDSNISIQPANPEVIYVPAYDPWVIYGAPIYPWPDWYTYPGIWFSGPYVSFGIGLPIGYFGGFAWGWPHWGFDWRHRIPVHGGRPWRSGSTTFYNRGGYYGRPPGGFAGGARPPPGRPGARPPAGRPGAQPPPEGAPRPIGGGRPAEPGHPGNLGRPMGTSERPFNTPGAVPRPFNGSVPAARGYAPPQGESGMRSGAFSGYNRGGDTRAFSSRGGASFGHPSPPRVAAPHVAAPRGGRPR